MVLPLGNTFKSIFPAPNPLQVAPLVPLTVLSSLFFCWASSWRRARQVGPALPPQLNTTPSCITSFESLYAKKQMQLFSHGRAYMRCMIWGEVYLGVEGIVTSWTHRQGRWEAGLRSQHLDWTFSFFICTFFTWTSTILFFINTIDCSARWNVTERYFSSSWHSNQSWQKLSTLNGISTTFVDKWYFNSSQVSGGGCGVAPSDQNHLLNNLCHFSYIDFLCIIISTQSR